MRGLRVLGTLGLSSALSLFGCDVGGQTESSDPNATGTDSNVSADVEVGPTPVQRHGRLRVQGPQLVDAAGNAVQLKGVSSMWLNWEDDGFAESLPALRWMRNNWNLSLIRAAMGVEPSGAYLSDPATARAQVTRIVDNAIAAGVYVIVDWHAHQAHTEREAAVAFFSEISAKYKGVPNVLYETFNEPENISWPLELKPYHEAVVAAIRANDPDAVIILGTPRWSQLVGDAAADPVAGTNLMYTLHFYACDHTSRVQGQAALNKGIGVFVTEWGATPADGGAKNRIVCLDKAQEWIDWMRENHISWAAWKLDNCPDSSCLFPSGRNVPLNGGWTDQYLQPHGLFVRGRIQE